MRKKIEPGFKKIKLIAQQIGAIASITFHELLREKILWSSFVFALLCIGLALAVSQLSYAETSRIALNFGLASISIVGGLLSVIMGAALIAKEVQNRTLYLLLTKSIWRWQFVLGRFLGLLGVLAVNTAIMVVVVFALFKLQGGSFRQEMAQSLLLQVTEFALLAAMASIFSAFSTTALSAIFASGIWVIGHAITDLRILSGKVEPEFVRPVMKFLVHVLPDLNRFDIKAQVAHELAVTWGYTTLSMLYGFAYIAFALTVACVLFAKRDL